MKFMIIPQKQNKQIKRSRLYTCSVFIRKEFMNIRKYITRYIKDTGSTWYRPTRRYIRDCKAACKDGLLVYKDGLYSLPEIAEEERQIAVYVAVKLFQSSESYPKEIIDLFIRMYEEETHLSLDSVQKEAVYGAINNPIFILTGGPGTGKTFTLKCIHYCLSKILQTDDILFTAPTGNAARRIEASVSVTAYTVAKALHLHSEDDIPDKLNNKVVIVDEISMLDTKTCLALMRATTDSRLIFVGDVDQLPSVGYGSILRDLIDAGIKYVRLEKTFRQADESGLVANIERIKNGLYLGFVKRDDFRVFNVSDTNAAKDAMLEAYLMAANEYGRDQVVCLTPYRKKGNACAIQMNRLLQETLNPLIDQNYVRYHVTEDDFGYDLEIREKDPVLQLINTDIVSNGDIGTVKCIDTKKETVTVKYSDVTVTYHKWQLGQITLAYAMTVHKSQGAEYACVITSAIEDDLEMLSRNTIYTAVTRAKQKCIIITQKGIAEKACKRELSYERTTLLSQEIEKQRIRLDLTAKLCI